MAKAIGEYARDWRARAGADACRVIPADPQYYGRERDPGIFFAAVEKETTRVFRSMEQANITMPPGTFPDFGCGVGRIRFFDSAARRADLENNGLPDRYLSRMYFARMPDAGSR